MKETNLPFGMLFQEVAQRLERDNPTPYYDSKEGISYMVNDNNKPIPYVEWANHNLGTITGRLTENQSDTTDTDPGDD